MAQMNADGFLCRRAMPYAEGYKAVGLAWKAKDFSLLLLAPYFLLLALCLQN